MYNREKAKNYILYARKSSESADRQEASLRDQKAELQKLSERLDLSIIEVIEESKSAKQPGRPGFSKMVQMIQEGKADGILCWKLNRLARNPIDGGQIQWMLQNGTIKNIQTAGGSHYPTDPVLLLQVELGIANQFVRDLAVDVKRGLRQKALRGWCPTKVPLGYRHVNKHIRKPGQDEIIKDNIRWELIRMMFNLFLSEKHSISSVHREITRLGLTNLNGSAISLNGVTSMLENQFYTGYFEYELENGIKERIKGKHPVMISQAEHRKCLTLRKGKTVNTKKPKRYNGRYTACFRCPDCERALAVDIKERVTCTKCKSRVSTRRRTDCQKCHTPVAQMKKPTHFKAEYYRCSGCKYGCEFGYVSLRDLETAINSYMEQFQLHPKFFEFVELMLEVNKRVGSETENLELPALRRRLSVIEGRIKALKTALLDGHIEGSEYGELNKALSIEKEDLTNQIDKINDDLHKFGDSLRNIMQHIRSGRTSILPSTNEAILELVRDLALELRRSEGRVVITSKLDLLEIQKAQDLSQDFEVPVEPLEFLEKEGRLGALQEQFTPV